MRAGPAGGGQPRGFGRPFGRWPSATGCMRPSLPSPGQRGTAATCTSRAGTATLRCTASTRRAGPTASPSSGTSWPESSSTFPASWGSPVPRSTPTGVWAADLGLAYRAWGPNSREARSGAVDVRRPRGGATNIKLNAWDSRASPYLALGGVIAAGLDGLERRPAPRRRRPEYAQRAEAGEAGCRPAVPEPREAIENLKRDDVLMDAQSEPLSSSYIAVREGWHSISPRTRSAHPRPARATATTQADCLNGAAVADSRPLRWGR